MHADQSFFSPVVIGLAAACRTVALATLMTLVLGGVLGAALSVHMAQVFDRVTSLHATAMPAPALVRVAMVRDRL